VRIGWAVGAKHADLSAGAIAILRVRSVVTAGLPLRSGASVRVRPGIGFLQGLRQCLTDRQRGEPVMVVGSPFGLLSREVFMNTVSTGVISNIVRDPIGCAFQGTSRAALLTQRQWTPCSVHNRYALPGWYRGRGCGRCQRPPDSGTCAPCVPATFSLARQMVGPPVQYVVFVMF
jgi:hypothetical protein